MLPSPAVRLVYTTCLLVAASSAVAEQPTQLPPVTNLLERLEASEQRIESLEAALREPTSAAQFQSDLGDSVEQRLAELERERQQYLADEAQAEAEAASKPSLKINGRIHLDYWNFTDDSPGIGFFEHDDPMADNFGADPEDRFFFRRIRLNFQGDLFETMLYRMQFDLNTPDSAEIKDVYVGFKSLPVLGTVLIGNQKRPLGLDHLNSSRFNIFIERPLVVEAFNEDARRLGVAAYNTSDDLTYNWRYGLYTLENLARDGKVVGDSMQLSGNARLAASPWYDDACDGRRYFHWAVSGMIAKPDGDVLPADSNANEGRFRTRAELRSESRWLNTGRIAGADWYEVLGLESMLNLGPLQVVSEYQSSWMQRDDVTMGTGPDLHFHGAYVYLAYMLTGEHVPLNRARGTLGRVRPFDNFSLVNGSDDGGAGGWGAWQAALRYSYLDLTDNDISGGEENNLTFGLVWYFNAYSSLQFNAIYGDLENRSPAGGFSDGHFTALGTRLRLNF